MLTNENDEEEEEGLHGAVECRFVEAYLVGAVVYHPAIFLPYRAIVSCLTWHLRNIRHLAPGRFSLLGSTTYYPFTSCNVIKLPF